MQAEEASFSRLLLVIACILDFNAHGGSGLDPVTFTHSPFVVQQQILTCGRNVFALKLEKYYGKIGHFVNIKVIEVKRKIFGLEQNYSWL